MPKNPKVAVLIMESVFTHKILKGVREYVLKCATPWHIHMADPRPEVFARLKEWKPDGILAYATQAILPELNTWDGPLVNISNRETVADAPNVRLDNVAVGGMAGKHLQALGYRQFAFCGINKSRFSDERMQGFQNVLERAGQILYFPDRDFRPCSVEEWKSWKARANYILSWLQPLPRPLAVFCANDETAKELADICLQAGIPVPEQIAILGVDNSVLCELTIPSLSSIEANAQRQGFEAADTLDRLMSGQQRFEPITLIPPLSVAVRESTEITALHDADLADAVRFIREHFSHSIDVRDILKKVPVSRRTLERKFQESLGRSPQQEIRRVRLDRARELLIHTDLSVRVISQRTGFANPQRFAYVFKDVYGESPLRFRKTKAGIVH